MDAKIQLIDTHAHIYDSSILSEIDELHPQWLENGVEKIYMPNIDVASIESMLEVETRFANCEAMMGLHPCYVKEDYLDQLKVVEQWLGKREFCAVGEIGIDLYWDKTFVKEQEDAFKRQIIMARDANIPFVIHSRDSLDLTIDIVTSLQDGNLKGIFHCFTGSLDQAKRIKDIGFMMGIGGVVTFKNSGLDKVVSELNIEDIVLETDAPYLAPTPHRGKMNQPLYLQLIASRIAEIMGRNISEVGSQTTLNAKSLFT